MQVRVFQREDSEQVVALWREAGLTRGWNDPYREIARKLLVQPELFLLAVDGRDDSICGTVMAGYDGTRGWLHYVAVSKAAQGQGVGRLLVQQAKDKLVAMGCCKINLQVRDDNPEVLAFYSALGFSVDPVVSMGLRLIDD